MVRNLLVAVALLLAWTVGASAEWKEGLWEITSKVEMPGMPKDMPASTMRQCMTKKDTAPAPASKDGSTECTKKEQKISGDTVTYAMECKNKDGSIVDVKGKMTFKGSSFDGSGVTTVTQKGQQPMKITSKMSGKYIGPCTK